MEIRCRNGCEAFDAKVADVQECIITDRWITFFVRCPGCGISCYSIGLLAGKYKNLKKKKNIDTPKS